LGSTSLAPLWTSLYNHALGDLTRFNHTVVMGSMLTGLVVFPLSWWGAYVGVDRFRTKLLPGLDKWKVVKAAKASKPYYWYLKISQYTFW